MVVAEPTPAERDAVNAKAVFPAFVDLVMRTRPTLSGSLAHVRPLKFEPGTVVLGCETAFDANTLGGDETKKWLEGLLTEHLGAPTTLTLQRVERSEADQSKDTPATLDEIDVSERKRRYNEKKQQARLRPAVKAICEEFAAEVNAIRVFDEV